MKKLTLWTLCLSTVWLTACGEKKTTETIIQPVQPNSVGTQERSININPFGVYADGGAFFTDGTGPLSGLYLPDLSSLPTFSFGFTVPDTYTSGTNLVLSVIWHSQSVGCSISFRTNSMTAARAGSGNISGPFVDSGLAVVGGTTILPAVLSNASVKTEVTISSPNPAIPLIAGDVVHVSLYRQANSINDTCLGDMVIQGLMVRYP